MQLDRNKDLSIIDSSTIFVSLYLFLLIFFVLLNTIEKSNQEGAKEAVKSINLAFSPENLFNKIQNKNSTHDSDPLILRNAMKYKEVAQISKIFSNKSAQELPLDKNDNNNIAKYSMPISAVFYDNSNILQNESYTIFENLAKKINLGFNQHSIRVEITIGNNLASKDIDINDENILNSRISKIYEKMINQQANERFFLVGINQSERKSVIFSFYYLN